MKKKNFSNYVLDHNKIFVHKNVKAVQFLNQIDLIDQAKLFKQSFWIKHRNHLFGSLLKKYSKSKTIYDIGCGNGYLTCSFKNLDFEVFGVEPCYESCKLAKSNGLENIVNTSIFDKKFTFPSDINITLFDVIEHIEDDEIFLVKIHELMDDNSILYISVPAFNLLYSQADIYAGHYRRYDKKLFMNKLDKLGFRVIYSSYFFSYLFFPIFFFRAIPYFLKFKLRTNAKSGHKPLGLLIKFFNLLSSFETRYLLKGKSLFFGSSLFFVLVRK